MDKRTNNGGKREGAGRKGKAEYFYGKPQQRVDVTSNSETLNIPIINFIESETE